MENILVYKFDHKLRIIFERIAGRITFDDIIAFHKEILSDTEYNNSYSIFSDIKDSVFELSQSERGTLCNFLNSPIPKENTNRKCAFITKKPMEVVGSELFRIRMENISPINIKTFSTKEAAFRWLRINDGYIIKFDN